LLCNVKTFTWQPLLESIVIIPEFLVQQIEEGT
jgi:hypothetical protein